MPYSNIVWIKLFLSLFEEDDRFLYQLNESQQLLYIKLLYLAGATDNQIPKNVNFICNKVNYHHEQGCFLADMERIKTIFPRFIEGENYYYFNNFHELHNRLAKKDFQRTSKGLPKELQRVTPEIEIEEEKNKKYKYLDFVFLTKKEYSLLEERFKSNLPARLESLNNYIGSKGKKYKSHYHTLLSWEIMQRKDEPKGRCDF
jgi:hypothetical protein